MIRLWMLNKNIGSKSLHHFVQRSLVPFVTQQVAKPQVMIRSWETCSKPEERVLDRMYRMCGDLGN